jgi:type IX secretion system PorP/SprF family membrane protein
MVSDLTHDQSAGLYFKSPKLQIGLGVSHLSESVVILEVAAVSSEIRFVRHYFLNGSYNTNLTRSVSLQPSIMVKSDGRQFQGELNAMAYFGNAFWAGLGFRGYSSTTYDAVLGFAGITLTEGLKIGYAYDFNVSALNRFNSGSHEVVLNYRIPLAGSFDPGKIIYNPRNL